jgi:hypothetical protein
MNVKETAKDLTVRCKSVAEASEYAFLNALLNEKDAEFWLEVFNEIESGKTIA